MKSESTLASVSPGDLILLDEAKFTVPTEPGREVVLVVKTLRFERSFLEAIVINGMGHKYVGVFLEEWNLRVIRRT